MDHQGPDQQTSKNPLGQAEGAFGDRNGSAEADLGQDALAGQQLGAEADDEAEHGQAAVPGLSEVDETETGLGGVGHEEEPIGWKQCNKGWRFVACAFGDTVE